MRCPPIRLLLAAALLLAGAGTASAQSAGSVTLRSGSETVEGRLGAGLRVNDLSDREITDFEILDPVCRSRSGGGAVFGRRTFVWSDTQPLVPPELPSRHLLLDRSNPMVRVEFQNGYRPPDVTERLEQLTPTPGVPVERVPIAEELARDLDPPYCRPGTTIIRSFDPNRLGGLQGRLGAGECRDLYEPGDPEVYDVPTLYHPILPIYFDPICPRPPGNGEIPDDLAAASWRFFAALVTSSCPVERGDSLFAVPITDASCFDSQDPLSVFRCSFRAPQLCQNVIEHADEFGAEPLEGLAIDAVSVRAKRSLAGRVRVRGRFDADWDALGVEDHDITLMLGDHVVTIPFEDVIWNGRVLLWFRNADGIRLLKIYRDGRFVVIGKNVEVDPPDPRTLSRSGPGFPLFLRLGKGFGATTVPLDPGSAP